MMFESSNTTTSFSISTHEQEQSETSTPPSKTPVFEFAKDLDTVLSPLTSTELEQVFSDMDQLIKLKEQGLDSRYFKPGDAKLMDRLIQAW